MFPVGTNLLDTSLVGTLPGLGTASPTEAKQYSPVKGTGSTGRQQRPSKPLLQQSVDMHEDQAIWLLHMYMGLALVHSWLVAQSLGALKSPG